MAFPVLLDSAEVEYQNAHRKQNLIIEGGAFDEDERLRRRGASKK